MSDAQQVLIEFVVDDTQLDAVEDRLVKLGVIDAKSASVFKQTNDQLKQRNDILTAAKVQTDTVTGSISKEQEAYNKLLASVKSLSGASKEAAQNLLKFSPQELSDQFKSLGTDVDSYITSLQGVAEGQDEVTQKTQSVRAELKQLTNQLALLNLNGDDSSETFHALTARVGLLKNAMVDAGVTVSNLGADLPQLKVFQAGVSTISGAFTAGVGAISAFDSSNKDLQETLVKVNAVMAINAGIQQVLNTVADEGLISAAKSIAVQKIKNAQTLISNGLDSESVIVRTAATVAQYALNLAMSLNPIGIVVIALAAFVTGIIYYTSKASEAARVTADLNATLARTGDELEAGLQGSKNVSDKILADLDQRNARESEKQAEGVSILKNANKQRLEALNDLDKKITENEHSNNADVIELVGKLQQQRFKIEQDAYQNRVEIYKAETALKKQLLAESLADQINNIQASLSIVAKNSNREFSLRRQLAQATAKQEINDAGDDAAKVLAIRSQLARNIKDIDIAQAKVAQDDIAAFLQTALIKSQNESRAINDRQSQEEIDRQKAIILEQASFDVKQEGLSENEKINIRAQANQKIIELQRAFNTQTIVDALNDQISLNAAQLAQVQISDKKKLDLQIQNIILTASIEIEQNRGKADKIKEIEAKRDADIKAARLVSIQDTLQKELALQNVQQAAITRRLEAELAAQDEINNAQGLGGDKLVAKQLGIQKLSAEQQKQIVNELTAFKLEAIQKEINATNEEFAEGLISFEDYTQKILQLEDKQVQAHEDAETKKRLIDKKTADLRKARNQEILKDSIQAASDAVGILAQFYQQDTDAANARIEAQKAHVQALQDAGEITAKEAMARNKALDAQQKQLQQQQAKRQKELDLFAAIINTALAVTNALTSGDPYTAPFRAAIAGAIGAAQIALIASRPIPQFGKGKKNRYEGLAEVGETGPELVGRKGKLQLYKKRSITWLGADDKVYNPIETLKMMNANISSTSMPSIKVDARGQRIDYKRMGDEVGKSVANNIPITGLAADEKGIYEYHKSREAFKKYLGGKRSWVSR